MDDKRFGFVTPAGLIVAGLTILVIAVITLFKGGVLFSPGALNAQAGSPIGGYVSHAEFAGQCRLCHAPFWDFSGMDSRCTSCHTDITRQLADPSSLHAAILRTDPALACRNCHPDHRGASASLTDFASGNFPHETLGFSLAGHLLTTAGRAFLCSDCHGGDIRTFSQETCRVCHEQVDAAFTAEHLLAFGSDCLECHDGIDTYGSDFNHNLFPFQLTGKHVAVTCTACHPGARTIADLRSTPTDCYSCHAADDTHQGSFGTDCGICHTTAGWIPASFDHSRTNFPLVGKHAEVPCEACHAGNIYAGTPVDCYSCHAADDTHQGAFGTDCSLCHTAFAWTPATFDHNLSAFKLTGAHASVPCASCHVGGVYKGTPSDCYACHAGDDKHNGSFGTSCASCHSTSAWLPASFNHNITSFPLTGAHAGLTCTQCHTGGVYTGLPTACASCHSNPSYHAGLFTGMSCSQCHSTSSWTPASYPLSHPGGCDGNCIGHEGATCRDCHPTTLSSATCSRCHEGNPGDGGGDD